MDVFITTAGVDLQQIDVIFHISKSKKSNMAYRSFWEKVLC